MGAIPNAWLVHQVTIEPFTGEGPYGETFGPPVTVRCLVEDTRRRVLDDKGNRVVASSTLYAPLATVCPARSRVRLPDGRAATAAVVARRDGGPLPVPSHLEVSLV